jgi:hypothetical protein
LTVPWLELSDLQLADLSSASPESVVYQCQLFDPLDPFPIFSRFSLDFLSNSQHYYCVLVLYGFSKIFCALFTLFLLSDNYLTIVTTMLFQKFAINLAESTTSGDCFRQS